MTVIQKILICSLLAALLAGCGMVRHSASGVPGSDAGSASGSGTLLMSVSNYEAVQASLEQAHRDWKGTPYVLGGASERGVDCSSFVRIVFDQYFGVDLPPNTRTQLNVGANIRRPALRTGDLVFFRTGRKTMHVGIIVDDRDFLHASTSKGVMISSLDEHYWSSRYLAARRVM